MTNEFGSRNHVSDGQGSVVNLAAYQFVELRQLPDLRVGLRDLCGELELRGTVLISPEGINLCVAGTVSNAGRFVATLRRDPRFEAIAVKESRSDYQPFRRMLVKIKREIIAFGRPDIDPRRQASHKISPDQLKLWLDEGRQLTLLDVRNDYEICLGSFEDAVNIGIDHFRDFPAAVKRLPEPWKQQPLVMFCTGGIRCEKAGPYLEQQGFDQVFQLDGGILNYFEKCGGEHYRGECFVFDQRVALNSQLRESETKQCFVCQASLSAEDQESPFYVFGKSCPQCYEDVEEQQRKRIASRNTSIQHVIHPLPGSMPYENRLPVKVPMRSNGMKLIEFLEQTHPHVARVEWLHLCHAGLLRKENEPVSAEQRIRAGERYERILPQTIERDVNADVVVLFEDEALIAVDKPAPLPMHPSGRYNRNTLRHIMQLAFHPLKPRNAHRLDANTSGVVVFSKTRYIASQIQPQFERGEVRKEYLARVHGEPHEDCFQCTASIGTTPRAAGARTVEQTGLPARTEFEVVRRDSQRSALVLARPKTGRTNQIRIHLWHLGLPVMGDPLYLTGGALGNSQTLAVKDSPMCLHAHRITLRHPLTDTEVTFEAPLPAWAGDSSGEN